MAPPEEPNDFFLVFQTIFRVKLFFFLGGRGSFVLQVCRPNKIAGAPNLRVSTVPLELVNFTAGGRGGVSS